MQVSAQVSRAKSVAARILPYRAYKNAPPVAGERFKTKH